MSKELHKMTVQELGQLFPIRIEEYSEKWIDLYQREKQRIKDSFSKAEILRIDHIGSTAIPGLKAKPTIDILVQVSEDLNIQKLKEVFSLLEYQINEHVENPPPHLTFVKGYAPDGIMGQTFHVHIRYRGDWDEIRFRDYLIRNVRAAKEYEALKLELVEKYKHDREAYTNSKTEFIEKIKMNIRQDKQ